MTENVKIEVVDFIGKNYRCTKKKFGDNQIQPHRRVPDTRRYQTEMNTKIAPEKKNAQRNLDEDDDGPSMRR